MHVAPRALRLVCSLLAALGLAAGLSACTPGFTTVKIDFTTQTAALPTGYSRDYGQAYDSGRGYGWVAPSSSIATSIVGQGRDRNLVSDQRFDTFVHMQQPIAARWEYAIANGNYNVLVAVGDPLVTDSTHYIEAEGVIVHDHFVPTSTEEFNVRTARVSVTDGRLTIDAAGGTNTKIAWLEIQAPNPFVVQADPKRLATGVDKTDSVTITLSEPVDSGTVSSTSVKLQNPSGAVVAGSYNTDGAGSLVTFTPNAQLTAFTTYTINTNGSLKTTNGVSFNAFTSSFTTDDGGTPTTGLSFTRTRISGLTAPTTVTLGPDGDLYVGNSVGEIRRWNRDANGVPTGSATVYKPFGSTLRIITGLRFDPAASTTNLKLWISHGLFAFDDAANFTGKVSKVVIPATGTSLTADDVITGLPRSIRDHLNNGMDFGADGKLYLAQGSINGYGAPDAAWGNRAETPLSASILVADVNAPTFPDTVNVNTSTGYSEATGPVKRHATGVRNAYDLVWHPNGRLYAPVNESASGNAPAAPDGTPPALTNLEAGDDFLALIESGKYYGHPNPSIGKYTLNGGNPTSGTDAWEVSQYPVGTTPESNWKAPIHNFGLHRSPNGIDVYRNGAFGGALLNRLLVVEFSGGDDLLSITLNSTTGTVSSVTQVASSFTNPLDVSASAANGCIYVVEFGDPDTGSGGGLTTLRPNG